MTTVLSLNLSMSFVIIFSEPAISFLGSVGYIVAYASSFPVSARAATLHPVLYPGSMASTRAPFTGGTMRSFSVFLANTFTASFSARSVSSFLSSRSMDGAIRRLYASSMVAVRLPVHIDAPLVITLPAISSCIFSGSTFIFTLSFFSFSPRFTARTLWLGIFDTGSAYS